MGAIRDYRDLRVWRAAVEFTVQVYRLTATFPADEKYGLTSQLRRAAVSVASNTAEGQQRHATQDFIRFCRMALGSTGEIATQLEIAQRLGYLGPERAQEVVGHVMDLRRMLTGLVSSLSPGSQPAGAAQEDAAVYGQESEDLEP